MPQHVWHLFPEGSNNSSTPLSLVFATRMDTGRGSRELFPLQHPAATDACLTGKFHLAHREHCGMVHASAEASRPPKLQRLPSQKAALMDPATTSSSSSSSFAPESVAAPFGPCVRDASWGSDCTWAF